MGKTGTSSLTDYNLFVFTIVNVKARFKIADICTDLPSFCFCNPDKQFDALVNGKATKNVLVPQKSLPDLPPPRAVSY